MNLLANNKKVTSATFSFLKENVLSVTDLTRSNKLSEILNKYAGPETSEAFVIQNNKNRDAVGVLLDLEHYQRLLRLEEAIEQATDDYIHQLALARQDEKTNTPLTEVIHEDDFNFSELISSLSDFTLDED